MSTIRSIIEFFQFFANKLKKHCVSAYAAQAAFYIIMSAFPFFMFLLTMIRFLPVTEEDLIVLVNTNLPAAFSPYVVDIISEVYLSSTTTVISLTILTAIWASSRAFYSLIRGLNSVYSIEENRNFLILRFHATIHTIIFTFFLLATLLLIAFGNSIALALLNLFPGLQEMALLVISLRTSASLCILILFFLYLYIAIPNRKSHVLAELPGAIATSVGWIGFSFLYSYYIDHMSNFSNTYGSLTAVVLLMLWLYACMYMLLLGAELNQLFPDISRYLKQQR